MVTVRGATHGSPLWLEDGVWLSLDNLNFQLLAVDALAQIWVLGVEHEAIVKLFEFESVALDPHEAAVEWQDQQAHHQKVLTQLQTKLHEEKLAEEGKERGGAHSRAEGDHEFLGDALHVAHYSGLTD